MAPSLFAQTEHPPAPKILNDTPYLPFCMPDGPGDAFRGAVRAEGDIEQNVSLGRQEGPVDNGWINGVRLTDASVSPVRHHLPAAAMRQYLFRPRLGLALSLMARANPLGVRLLHSPAAVRV